MNWKRITLYAIALLVAQISIGFLEISLPLVGTTHLLVGYAISFLVCGAIFAHLAMRQSLKPFIHAWASLILQSVVGAVLLLALARGPDDVPSMLIAIELVVLACALIAGTTLGSSWRHRAKQAGA